MSFPILPRENGWCVFTVPLRSWNVHGVLCSRRCTRASRRRRWCLPERRPWKRWVFAPLFAVAVRRTRATARPFSVAVKSAAGSEGSVGTAWGEHARASGAVHFVAGRGVNPSEWRRPGIANGSVCSYVYKGLHFDPLLSFHLNLLSSLLCSRCFGTGKGSVSCFWSSDSLRDFSICCGRGCVRGCGGTLRCWRGDGLEGTNAG